MKKTFTKISALMAFAVLSSGAMAQNVILNEDFELGVFPGTWSQTTLATDGGFKVGINTALQSATFPIPAHSKFAATNDDACNCDKSDDVMATSTLNLSTVTAANLSFDCYFGNFTYQGITESADVVVSTDGGATWTSVYTIPGDGAAWQTYFVDLAAYVGNATVNVGFRYNDGGGWLYGLCIDNVQIFEPVAFDANLTAISPVAGTGAAYGALAAPFSISGTILNNGSAAITGLTIKYSDGTNTWSDVKTGLNIASFTSYNFTHSTPYNIPALGANNIKLWVELTGDANASNDTLNTTIVGVPFLPSRKMVFEEGTGTWCGWCPRGTVFMDSMHTVNPSSTVLIAVHNADPMVFAAYDAGIGGLISGYPSVLADRKAVIDPSDMFNGYNSYYSDFGFANLTVNAVLDQATNVTTAYVDATFATDLYGDFRLAVVYTEDNVTGTTSTYNQSNYYSFQSQNIPLQGAGHNWQLETNPVLAANMEYDHVARTIVGGFKGQAGSLPMNLTANSSYGWAFNWNKNAAYNVANMHVYALLINFSTGEILNANEGTITLSTTGINDNSNVSFSNVYPNPASDLLNVSFNLNSNENIVLNITDVLGKSVQTIDLGNQLSGTHTENIDISELPSGIYSLNVQTSAGIKSHKFVKE